MAGNEYSKLTQADEEIGCQFVKKEKDSRENDARKSLIIACAFCTVFIVCEVIGGFLANSLAVMNDAIHQFFDLNSLLLSLIASWIARWKPNDNKTFGYYRAEILGACVVIATLWLLTGVLAYESILRLIPGHSSHHSHINSNAMILTAALAFSANIIIIFLLNGHSHLGGHHHHEANMTVKAAILHTLGDVCHSFAVLVGAILIKINPSWEIADPIISLVGACVVLLSTCSVLKQSVNILLEGVPSNIRLADLRKDLTDTDHVISIHKTHVWSLTTGKTILSAHLVVDSRADANTVLAEVTRKMCEKYQFYHTCLQIEIPRKGRRTSDIHRNNQTANTEHDNGD